MLSVPARRRLRQWHRVLGLMVGLQLLFWVSGGLIMSSFDIDLVRGRHQAREQVMQVLPGGTEYLPPGQVLAAHPGTQRLELSLWQQRPVYRLSGSTGRQLVDALSGEVLSPLDEEAARGVALQDFAGDAKLSGLHWLTEPALEYRGRDLPLWRADFNDTLNTALYISPTTGQIVARRNDVWRLFDVVWMLHIMDYRQRDDFNHPLLIGFAATTLAFILSGLGMLLSAYWRR